jgi:hypothetical protein
MLNLNLDTSFAVANFGIFNLIVGFRAKTLVDKERPMVSRKNREQKLAVCKHIFLFTKQAMTCDHKFTFPIATIQLCDLSSKSATACGTHLPVFHFLSFLYNWFFIDQEKTPFMQTSKPDVPSSYHCSLQWEKNVKMDAEQLTHWGMRYHHG